jgi:pimeloyl-ACP methyl ester carboxylesterase
MIGFPVLRFDPDGTGNSAGSDNDPGRVRAWIDSLKAAVLEVEGLSGATEVSLLGLRLGGALAVLAANELGGVESLVLWAPVISGRSYVRELRARRLLTGSKLSDGGAQKSDARADEDGESQGFLLTGTTRAELAGLRLLAISTRPARRVLIVDRDDLPADNRLPAHLRALGVDVDLARCAGYSVMMSPGDAPAVPGEVVAVVNQWFERTHGTTPGAGGACAPLARRGGALQEAGWLPAASIAAPDGTAVVERAMLFGEAERLFGILAEPAMPMETGVRPGIVLVNSGGAHHIGVNRMYVHMAREWASRGFRTFRMDLGGLGESRPAPSCKEAVLYAPSSGTDIEQALQFLRANHGLDRFVLIGLCAGAYAAFHAALRLKPVVGIVLLNIQVFSWQPGQTIAQHPVFVLGDWRWQVRRLRSRLLQVTTWRRALGGRLAVRETVRDLLPGVRLLCREKQRGLLRAANLCPPGSVLAADLRSLAQLKVEMLFVFEREALGLRELERQARPTVRRLSRRPNFRVKIIEGANHVFTPVESQRRLLALLSQHLIERHGADTRRVVE